MSNILLYAGGNVFIASYECLVHPLLIAAFYNQRVYFLGNEILQQMALTAQWDVYGVIGHMWWRGIGAYIK